MNVNGQLYGSSHFEFGERVSGMHWIGGWFDLTAGLGRYGGKENSLPLPRIEPQFLGRPSRNLSLYRLNCPDT
jgi:hypothetical protein